MQYNREREEAMRSESSRMRKLTRMRTLLPFRSTSVMASLFERDIVYRS